MKSHNFVDKAYHRLNFEFFTFGLTVNNSTGDIFFELTNVDTKERHVQQIPEIKRNKITQGQEAIKAEIDYDEMIDYYMRLSYSSKLGLEPLSPEQLRDRSGKYQSKCTKEFKINLEIIKKTAKSQKSVATKLPSKVKLIDFCRWCDKHITGGIEGRGAKHKFIHRTRSGVFKIRIYLFDIYK